MIFWIIAGVTVWCATVDAFTYRHFARTASPSVRGSGRMSMALSSGTSPSEGAMAVEPDDTDDADSADDID